MRRRYYTTPEQATAHDMGDATFSLFALLFRLCLGGPKRMLFWGIVFLWVYINGRINPPLYHHPAIDIVSKPYDNCERERMMVERSCSAEKQALIDVLDKYGAQKQYTREEYRALKQGFEGD